MSECPRCHRPMTAIATAYGKRAICAHCNVRWTYINGFDMDWYPEKRHPTDERWTP